MPMPDLVWSADLDNNLAPMDETHREFVDCYNVAASAAPEDFLPSSLPGPEELAERSEAARMVRAVLDELSEDHRSVVTLRFIEGLSYEEIAEAIDCPIGTVKSRIHYALRKIGERLTEEGLSAPED